MGRKAKKAKIKMRCISCNRPLRDPESVKYGMGPKCLAKTGSGQIYLESEGQERLPCFEGVWM